MNILKAAVFGVAALAAVTVAAPAVHAGGGCTARELSVDAMQNAVDTAVRIKAALEGSGGGAAVIARVGSDISAHGLKYTHAGIVHFDVEKRQWIVTHQLNECGSGGSILRNHGLLEFMLDDPFSYDVLILSLAPRVQEAVRETITGGDPLLVYEPRYNMIAYPGGEPKYQNSNQWILEIIAQSQARLRGERLTSRRETLPFYWNAGFEPTVIRISGFKRMFGGLAANVQFDDHPANSAETGQYQVVSVKSLADYLRRNRLLNGAIELKP